ncbi:MAG: pyridoxine 5'-phosphate synthase [Gammaproteobacteria bacterium CG22_combo_CG10-13_8_21_14_all_40_8]|nr:MAG: pyridoxine 5'-phosphate synthase [Gammaproteobacteria bacterium CG22_combo_CG10-13_8_21_14_all_40_8]
MIITPEVLLGVNIDHIATLRQVRGTEYPDPVQAALMAEQAGADGITAHLREDRRHIQDRDIELLSRTIHTRLNFEMAITEEMLAIAEKINPAFCCFVPEKRAELTTEGGLDVLSNQSKVAEAIDRLSQKGILVSLFIDAKEEQIQAAAHCKAPYIEIHTGQYADTKDPVRQKEYYQQIKNGAEMAAKLGIKVNAGHGLHYHNVKPIAAIPEMIELNIGHAIIARAAICGLDTAVRDMKRLLIEARLCQ